MPCMNGDPPGLPSSPQDGGVVLPSDNGVGPGRKGGKRGGAGDGDEGGLQTQNGQGDTLSQSSSILQACAGGAGRMCTCQACFTFHSRTVSCPTPCQPQQLATARVRMNAPHCTALPPCTTKQDNWDAVLALATDTAPSAPGSALSPPGSGGELAPGTHVRRRVVELMEIVLR